MVKKYAKALENREINAATGEIWNIADVPDIWRGKVEAKIEEDKFYIAEDGTVYKIPINEMGE